MVLGTLAEQSLPFTSAPVIVELMKQAAKDPDAVANLNMEGSSAQYKMVHGLAKTFHDQTVEELQKPGTLFSLNIDEATSTNLQKVLDYMINIISFGKYHN